MTPTTQHPRSANDVDRSIRSLNALDDVLVLQEAELERHLFAVRELRRSVGEARSEVEPPRRNVLQLR
jgi:hypothetical protein